MADDPYRGPGINEYLRSASHLPGNIRLYDYGDGQYFVPVMQNGDFLVDRFVSMMIEQQPGTGRVPIRVMPFIWRRSIAQNQLQHLKLVMNTAFALFDEKSTMYTDGDPMPRPVEILEVKPLQDAETPT